MESLEKIVAEHPFARGLNPRYLHLLTECATLERFGEQEQIFHEGFDANRFYLVQSGRVTLRTFVPGRGVTTIQSVGVGDALGWSWLYPPFKWHFSAVAEEVSAVVSLSAKKLRDSMEENRDFGYSIAMRVGQLMLERLQATRLRLLEVYDVPG